MTKKLLIVDNEPNILRSLARLFEGEDYYVLTASSAAEGLILLKQYTVQVVVSDNHMPNMSGVEFLAEVKKLYPETVRIILSGYADIQAVKDSINNGAIYKFLDKPWDNEVLRREIYNAFSLHAQQQNKNELLRRLMNHVIKTGVEISIPNPELFTEDDLKVALEKEQFVIHYQPIVSPADRQVVGAEALIRWQHPTSGLISPNEFITFAEHTGLIIPISAWVLKTVCQQLKTWQAADRPEMLMSTNLSVIMLNNQKLQNVIRDNLTATGLAPHTVNFEISENLFLQNVEMTQTKLHAMKEVGVKLAIDNFGKGYSSLEYLRNFPIDILKIDKSIVVNMSHDQVSADIVGSIIAFAKTCGMKSVAEGVETQEQFDRLMELKCDYIQGYHVSKPMTAQAFTEFLTKSTIASKDR